MNLAINIIHQMGDEKLPILAIRIGSYLLLNHVDHDIITDKSASIHNLLGLLAQFRLLRDLSTKHIARCKMTNAVLVFDIQRLCSFTYITSQSASIALISENHDSSLCHVLRERGVNAPAPGGPINTILNSPSALADVCF
jgi:hypothetical protein